jgi:NAD(P)-dependent dehydrogenase (short-subunit alcohol dehydrogenase family)
MKAEALFDVRGSVVAVTGGASGIGYACAEVMADNGAKVTLIDLDRDALARAVAALSGRGLEVQGELADVVDPAALRRAIAAIVARHGRIDVMFANAGISGGPGFLKGDGTRNPDAALESLSLELWERVIATNLTSVFKTLQAVVPQMKAQGGGRIVVTSSISATKTEIYVGTPYVASKAGVAQLVRQAALELAKYNIQVNAIAPGPVVTNIAGGRLKSAEARAPFERAAPMHRIATPDDIQGAALFLASPASSYITGIQIVIDGGVTLGTAD